MDEYDAAREYIDNGEWIARSEREDDLMTELEIAISDTVAMWCDQHRLRDENGIVCIEWPESSREELLRVAMRRLIAESKILEEATNDR